MTLLPSFWPALLPPLAYILLRLLTRTPFIGK